MNESGAALDAGRLRVAVARLARQLRRHSVAGLTPVQLSTLATVDRCGPLRLGDLAAAEGIQPSTLTRLVNFLEEGGLVKRHSDPSDARSSFVQVTERGQKLLMRLRTESTQALAQRLARLSERERAALEAALPALERLAEVENGRRCR